MKDKTKTPSKQKIKLCCHQKGERSGKLKMSASPHEITQNPLARDFRLPSLLKFAMPTILMMIFMGLYTVVDTVFVARFINTDALSAVNIVCPVINIIVGLSGMLATGGSAIIARKMGAGKTREARQDFTLIVIAAAVMGLLIALLGTFFLGSLIRGLGASPVLYSYCRDYLFILLLFSPASCLQVIFQNLMVTAGRPGLGTVLSVNAGLINIVLDYIFIIVLDLGIAGCALGTGIGYTFPAVLGLVYFFRSRGTLYFVKPSLSFRVLSESLLNGSSEMVSQAAAAVTTFLFNRIMMGLLGENGVAAITIIIYTQFMLSTLYMGFSMGVAPVISYNFGSGNSRRLIHILKSCLAFIGVLSVIIFITSMILGGPLVHIFSPEGSEVYDIARKGFMIFPYSFLFCGINIFASATFTALSNGKVSAVISFLRTFGFITAALLVLPKLLGVHGVWLAVPLAEAVTVVMAVGFLGNWMRRLKM